MISLVRAGLAAALFAFAPLTAHAADKPFQNRDLADSAIKLEAQIKSDAGAPTKPVAQIRRDADAAFAKNDFRSGMALLGQIVAAAPTDSATWLRLARTIMQVRPANDDERKLLLERASTAAYIAYQRTTSRAEEADSLVLLGNALGQSQLWRPALDALRLSLELREVADVRGQYEKLREQHGFRVLDYSVDADTASPRACFQFSEALPLRADFSPFVVVAGTDKPALTAADQQLCVEGLQHGESYTVTLRAGLPSVVHETLSKSADFSIYVRDRKPFVHFSTNAYVLPRVGQRGIPVISTNTRAIAIEIYRLGDRSVLGAIGGDDTRGDFQHSLGRYEIEQLRAARGVAVWKGELAVEAAPLNADVTTAFPVDQAVGELKPGVYVMVAQPQELKNVDNDFSSLATQWFIVSDLGLSAFSGNDGIHVFVNSLATTESKNGVEVRLISRGNEVLATRRTDAGGHAQFEAGLAGGEGGSAPAMLTATDGQNDYAFLSLKSPAFDLTDRGVGGRPAPNGLDAFIYAERGVYRSGETAYLTALLRDAQGAAALGVPLTLVVERPDGVEFRRAAVADQGLGGHGLSLALPASAPTGTWHVRAFTDPKRPPVGATTFLVEDYVPDRIEFDLTSPSGHISQKVPAKVDVAGRFLYGAPAANLDLEGDLTVAVAKERTGFAGYQFGLADEEVEAVTQPLDDLPASDAAGKASFSVNLDKLPSSTHPLEAQITVRMAEPGGRAVEHKVTVPVTASGNMIGVKPEFSGRSLADGASATFAVVVVAPDGTAVAQRGLHYELLRIDTHYQFYKRDGSWNYEPVKTTKRVADGTVDTTLDKAGRIALPVTFGRYRLEVSTGDPDGAVTSVAFDAGFYVEFERRYARHAGSRARQGRVRAGRHDDGRGDRAQRRTAHAQCHRRSAAGEPDHRREAWCRPGTAAGRPRLGHRRLSGRDVAAAARRAGAAHAGPGHRRAMVRHRPRRKNARRRTQGAVPVAAELDIADSGEACRARGRRGRQDRGRRGRCRHSQSDQLQTASARRLLSRPTGACRGDPRPLRRLDRRHAGHPRPDSQRRRSRRAIAGQPAQRTAAGALFRHRDGRRRRQCRGDVRRA